MKISSKPLRFFFFLAFFLVFQLGYSFAQTKDETKADGGESEKLKKDKRSSQGKASKDKRKLSLEENTSSQKNGDENDFAEKESKELEPEPIEIESGNIFDIIQQGGILMIPLILLLLASLTLIIERLISYTRYGLWNTKLFEETLTRKEKEYPSDICKEGLEEGLQKESQAYIAKLERGMDLLNGIGNIAPLMGFLGTVIGMINAFTAIASTANVNAKVVASGIKEALVTTAGGLIIAVPTLIVYYIFTHVINKSVVCIDERIQGFCSNRKSITEK